MAPDLLRPVGGPRVSVRAPGRVNLMGDHTDYAGGRCFPIAIDRWITIEGETDPSSGRIELTSDQQRDGAVVLLGGASGAGRTATLQENGPEWARYVAAVAEEVGPAAGLRGHVRSTIPAGSGLSSSAALEVAVALALGTTRTGRELAELCQRAEHRARGVPTGILDQLAVVCGRAGHGLVLDCHERTTTPSPLPPPSEADIVVVAGPARDLAASAYAERVTECAAAEDQIGPLRLASPEDVARIGDPTLARRARHVVTENGRVAAFAAALGAGDLAGAGRLMWESHASLRDDHSCSTPEVDRLVEELRRIEGVFGARMTGGGWGGSVVALTRPGTLARAGHRPGWVVRSVDGAAPDPIGPR